MPAHNQQHAAEAPHGQQEEQCCVNCGVVGLPASYYRRHVVHGDYCAACYSYSSSHGGRARPEQLWQRQRHRMLEALDPNALRCTHCGRLPKEGELFHKCRHPRNGRPLCGTCHHYAWRKDGLMRPRELVARDPHMRDATGRPAQQAFHSGRPGTGSGALAASAAAAGREEAEAAAAAGGAHRARRGRPVREMSEAEQEAWHASWQLPAGYLPADAVPHERRAAGRRLGAANAAGQGEGAQQEPQEQHGRRQQWQQLVAWDGEGEAGQQAGQQEQGHTHVRPEDWEAPLHGARWEAPALPPAGRQRQQGGAGDAADAEQQQQQQQQPQQPQQFQQQQQQPPQQAVQRQATQQRQPPPTPQQVRQRPAVRAPVALASLGLQEADLFGEATAARARPQQPQQAQQRVTVRRAAPVQAPSRQEMQALIQAEREAELRRVQQQLEAAMEAERLRQRAAASYGGAMHGARAGGAAPSSDSCDTWGAAVRGNLWGGEEGQKEAEWDEGTEEEWQEEEGQEAQQAAQQQEQLAQEEQARQRKRARRRRQRWRRRQRLRQQQREEAEEEEDEEDEEEEEEEEEGSEHERYQLSTQTLRELIRAMSPQRVTAALEGELWKGQHPELQPLPASLRRKLGEGSCRFAGCTLCVSGIPDCLADVPFGQDEEDLVERTLMDALTACPWTIQTVHVFKEQGSSTWEADVRFWNAQDAARVLRFKLGLKLLGNPLTLRPDPDEVQYERTRLWHAKRSAILQDFKEQHCK